MDMILQILWLVISGLCVFQIWFAGDRRGIGQKALWSFVVCIPIAGWILFAGLYQVPGSGPTQTGNGDSGWGGVE